VASSQSLGELKGLVASAGLPALQAHMGEQLPASEAAKRLRLRKVRKQGWGGETSGSHHTPLHTYIHTQASINLYAGRALTVRVAMACIHCVAGWLCRSKETAARCIHTRAESC
jgi:hypothetical protein